MESLKKKIFLDFIQQERWRFITDGLQVTLFVTFFALIVGVALGAAVAIVRSANDQVGQRNLRGFSKELLSIVNFICKIYITVIRGTPVLVQLLLIYFVFMASSTNKVLVAVIAFGINSGAYVAEIIRSGIMAVDAGQMDAGRALGLSYAVTMWKIILPQAAKNILPALVNEMITLLKETSICGYIGLNELTRGGDIIRGITFDALLPLLAVAVIYLLLVMFFTYLMGKLERRLRQSDIR